MRMTRGELLDLLIALATRFPDFRQELLRDPRRAIERALGIEIARDLRIRALEEDAGTVYVVVPGAPSSLELADADLERVAGGGKAETIDVSPTIVARLEELAAGHPALPAPACESDEWRPPPLAPTVETHDVPPARRAPQEEVLDRGRHYRIDERMPGPRAEATSRQEPRSFRVWYGTNREPIDRQDLSVGFGGRRERDPGTVHYGICEITIPASHRFGSTGSTWWRRWLRRKDDRLKLGDICGLAAATFWGLLAKELSGRARSDRRALVYVHGFNVTFRDAAIRAAQIGCDLSEPGITAFFSWPSKGKPHEYPADEASIEASEEAIADFLVGFATRTRARQVNVVAYSMGNRGLLRALQRIRGRAERQSAVRFNQIFLAAPDVDADLFRQLAVVYREFAKRTTLYASASDLAVGLSGWIHSAPRAGFTPPVTVVPGIDTVVVPDFDVDRLGHGYYAAAEAVLHDMFDLLQRNAAPARRQRLAAQRIDESVRYWTMVR